MGIAKDIAEVAGSMVEPITKLIECINGALGKTFEPRQIKKKTEAEAERITILSEKLRENCDIPIVIKNDEISLSTPDYDEFLKRTQNRMAYQELKKQQNIETVANKAAAVLADEEAVTSEPVDQDWLLRFFNTVEDVGNEEMQEIWARLLAGEVKKPGTFSLRTLGTLRNMTHVEAVMFEKMCSHCIITAGSRAILRDEEYLTEIEIPFGMILKLSECGLINSSSFLGVDIKLNSEKPLVTRTDDYIAIATTNEIKKVNINIYPLTNSGIELSQIAGCHMALDEFKTVTKKIEEMTKVSPFPIYRIQEIQGERINYYETEDSLDE